MAFTQSSRFFPNVVSTEQFQVINLYCPIVAVLGKNAILPRALVPGINAEKMELRWFHTTLSQAVFIYWNQREQTEEQMADYRGWTSLVSKFLTQGQAAVHIHKVQVSDNGTYTCFFRHGGFSEKADLELKVAGKGSDPQVHIEGPEEDGVCVVCKASGWFPKPQVQWRDLSGNKFPALSEAHTQDSEELFSVEATLVVRDSSVGNVTCSVLNPVLGQEKAMAIYIPEPFFPQASPWKPAFAVILTMLGLLLLGASYLIRIEHSRRMQMRQEKEHLWQLKEEEQQAKEEVLKAIDHRKAAYLSAWRKAPLYADWRKEQFQASSFSGNLFPYFMFMYGHVSMTICSMPTSPLESYERALQYPDLVDCRANHGRAEYPSGCKRKKIVVQQDLCRMGVFLDYSERGVSYYNMIDGSHIFSFPPASFSGNLFPYFMFMYGHVSMTICSMPSESEGFPLPLHNSPLLEEVLSTPTERISLGCGVDGVPPAAECPLLP
uniref:LOW QUALITY PROTEIN: butyrophilin subfamily 1 member A1-like n=1 Tax=Ictidomys tridecemlineatus TaxID=43179 RepID=UPI001A9E376F|nr:LOW QUALITY PROTEIN: butyrophilin subfamily 1 member A1-like [Ictidomys tridecemlineatus]